MIGGLRIIASLSPRSKQIFVRRFVLVMIRQPFYLFIGLLLVFKPGEEDADVVDIIFEVNGIVVFDEHNLSFGTEVVLFDLPYHVPLALLLCRSGVFVCIPENAHLHLPAMDDC